jgi:hypothetical protein
MASGRRTSAPDRRGATSQPGGSLRHPLDSAKPRSLRATAALLRFAAGCRLAIPQSLPGHHKRATSPRGGEPPLTVHARIS